MTQTEFEAIMEDESKKIVGDIIWSEDEDHSPAVEFRVEVISSAGYPLSINGSFNADVKTLSFTLIHRGTGRIYALDMGKDHHNRTCQFVGEKHKHRWKEPLRDTDAYVPGDITATVDNVILVWQQFCNEAKIRHEGVMHIQQELL
jgi:hypothetical protein